MRGIVAILGTSLIAAVLILSGSAVATWLYVGYVVDYENCTNPDEALYAEDGVHATIGINSPPTLGWINLSFPALSGMPGNTRFTVFASSTIRENYSLQLWSLGGTPSGMWYGNDDTKNEEFTSPSLSPTDVWMYVFIYSEEGSTNGTDPIYGSEIDAVGWNSP